jgi:hypothetical protein
MDWAAALVDFFEATRRNRTDNLLIANSQSAHFCIART